MRKPFGNYLGKVADTRITPHGRTVSIHQEQGIKLAMDGPVGGKYSGFTRLLRGGDSLKSIARCGEVNNERSMTIVFDHHLQEISAAMGLPGIIPYGDLNENLVIAVDFDKGILPDLDKRMRFNFYKLNSFYSSVEIAAFNTPCRFPEDAIRESFPDVHFSADFKDAAKVPLRGLVGRTHMPGKIKIGFAVYFEYV